MSEDATMAYFDDIVMRAAKASVVKRDIWSEAQPAKCHQNCEAFVARLEGYAVVRGWLVIGEHLCIPHSVVRDLATNVLRDITPDPSESHIPFVEHCGDDTDFQSLRKGRDGGYVHHPVSLDILPTAFAFVADK